MPHFCRDWPIIRHITPKKWSRFLGRWLVTFVLSFVITTTALAQEEKLRRLESGEDARGWEAVGRLDIDGKGFCTGALIAPDVVLTAAHCLYDTETHNRIDETRVSFLAGWRNGRASAYRNVKRAMVHKAYVYDGQASSFGVRNDLALLELDMPIRTGRITPFETAAQPRRGDNVGVVSYAKDRSDAPSLQEVCNVMAQQDGILVTSCDVDFGSSGAPIFSFAEDGKPKIVSVVSAKAETDGNPVALGTALSMPLAELQAELVATKGKYLSGSQTRRVRVGQKSESGAKFVKP
ncbi:MAG: trypsin-like serine protease [Rhodobacteraceae bacterium]|nr:trypsin-like serine protease [Paracoccaceae bacterium]